VSKHAAGGGKHTLLPPFADLFAAQSAKIEDGKEAQPVPKHAEQDEIATGSGESKQLPNLPVAALHLPETLFAKSLEADAHAALHTSTLQEKSAAGDAKTKKTGEKEKSKTGVSPSAAAFSEIKANDALQVSISTPASSLPATVVQPQTVRQGQLVLSTRHLPASSGSPLSQIPSTGLPEQKTVTPAGIANTELSTAKDEVSVLGEVNLRHDLTASGIQGNTVPASSEQRATSQPALTELMNPSLLQRQSEGDLRAATVAADNGPVHPAPVVNAMAITQHADAVKPKETSKSISGLSRDTADAIVPAGSLGQRNEVSFATGAPAMNSVGNSSQLATGSKAQAATDSNPFQRLDAADSPATLLHANAHEVAVGVRDPSLGWVEIQTQSSAGHVIASLTAASAQAHASLAAQVPALTQYLADRNVQMHSIGVSTQSGQGDGGQSRSGSGPESYSQGKTTSPGSTQTLSKAVEDGSALSTGRSSYISVRA